MTNNKNVQLMGAVAELINSIYDYESDTFAAPKYSLATRIATALIRELSKSIRTNEPIQFSCDGVMLADAANVYPAEDEQPIKLRNVGIGEIFKLAESNMGIEPSDKVFEVTSKPEAWQEFTDRKSVV